MSSPCRCTGEHNIRSTPQISPPFCFLEESWPSSLRETPLNPKKRDLIPYCHLWQGHHSPLPRHLGLGDTSEAHVCLGVANLEGQHEIENTVHHVGHFWKTQKRGVMIPWACTLVSLESCLPECVKTLGVIKSEM